jgi:drug/metabolite transporter (DMT)-like permease
MRISNQLRGHLAAFFTIFVWGITFISTRVLMANITSLEITFYRTGIAVITLFIISPPKLKDLRPCSATPGNTLKIAAAGLCGVTLYFMFQNLALDYTLTANVGVLISVAPLFIALVSRAFLGEKLKSNFFAGFIAAITGIALIAFNGSSMLKLNPLGDLLSILAALMWAFYSVLIRKASSSGGGVFTLTRDINLFGFLFLLPILPLFGFRPGLERLASLPIQLNLLFLGVVASAICFVSWNYAVRILGPVKTSIYIYFCPVVTIIASAIILHEPVTPVSAAGIALILAGVALSERGKPAEAFASG